MFRERIQFDDREVRLCLPQDARSFHFHAAAGEPVNVTEPPIPGHVVTAEGQKRPESVLNRGHSGFRRRIRRGMNRPKVQILIQHFDAVLAYESNGHLAGGVVLERAHDRLPRHRMLQIPG